MIDPITAQTAQNNVLQNRTAARQFEIINAQEKRAIAEAAAQMDERQREQALEATKREVFRFLAAPTPEIFDQMVTQAGKPELAGMWANRQVLAADYVSSVEEALKLGAGPSVDPIKGAPTGYKWADPANPAAGVVPLPGYERSSGLTINTAEGGPRVGTVPQGYAAVEDPESPAGVRFVPIPGGPNDTSASDAARASSAAQTADIVLEDIGRLKTVVESAPWYSPAAGFGSGWLEEVRGTPAANAAALSETIGANIGFDRLQAMREASPTGGALGSITERELAALRAVLGNIERSQSEDQLVFNLERLEEVYTNILAKAAAYPNAASFGFSGGDGSGSPGTPPAQAGSTSSPQPSAPLPPDLQSIFDKYSTP